MASWSILREMKSLYSLKKERWLFHQLHSTEISTMISNWKQEARPTTKKISLTSGVNTWLVLLIDTVGLKLIKIRSRVRSSELSIGMEKKLRWQNTALRAMQSTGSCSTTLSRNQELMQFICCKTEKYMPSQEAYKTETIGLLEHSVLSLPGNKHS